MSSSEVGRTRSASGFAASSVDEIVDAIFARLLGPAADSGAGRFAGALPDDEGFGAEAACDGAFDVLAVGWSARQLRSRCEFSIASGTLKPQAGHATLMVRCDSRADDASNGRELSVVPSKHDRDTRSPQPPSQSLSGKQLQAQELGFAHSARVATSSACRPFERERSFSERSDRLR